MTMRKVIAYLCLAAAAGAFFFILVKDWPHIKGYVDSLLLYNRINEEGQVPDDERPDREFVPVREEEPETFPEETEAETESVTEKAEKKDRLDFPEIDWDRMHGINEDYIGWIYIPDASISYPVVQSEDNIDYLHRGFDGSYLFAGTIFMDCRNADTGVASKNAILYGHNMRIGTMFAGIKKYQEQKFFEKHDHFWFVAKDKAYRYRVFACSLVSPYDDNHFGVQFEDDTEFLSAVSEMMKSSLIKSDIRPNARDHIMTLSTCTPDHARRNVVHGVLDGTVDLTAETESEP